MNDREPLEEPDWSAHGLAAMDELRRLYFEGSADRGPGHIAVVDWDACENAIRAALTEADSHPYHEACRKCYATLQSKRRRIEKLSELLREVAEGDTEVDMQGRVSIRIDQSLWKRILGSE